MQSQPPRNADSAWLATLTVLYVEDEQITRALLSRFLRRRVGCVVEATDGVDGLAQFKAHRPAIVITDIQMPTMDGLAMAEEIRRLDPGVPIVVTTAFEQIGYLERSIDAGIDKYVTKPVDTDKLETALLVCARRQRAEALLARERQRELDAVRSREREALGMLAGGMAHDFNNLLQSILGNVDLAMPLAPAGGEMAELLGSALEATQQAVDLSRGLLTLSEGWAIDAETKPILPTLQGALAGALAGAPVDLTLQVPADLPPLPHDLDLMGRTFRHLAENAREAMPEGGRLRVTARLRAIADDEAPGLSPGRYLEVSLQDTGHGIPRDVLPRIFDPYFSTKRRGTKRGMGLGLALCAAVIRKHHGRITAASEPGGGATITVLLPTEEAGDAQKASR